MKQRPILIPPLQLEEGKHGYSIAGDRKFANPYAFFFYHDDAADFEMLFQRGELAEEEPRLFLGAASGEPPKEDDGWPFRITKGEKGAEVRVCGDDGLLFPRGEVEDFFVGGGLHYVVPDVFGVVSGFSQDFGDLW